MPETEKTDRAVAPIPEKAQAPAVAEPRDDRAEREERAEGNDRDERDEAALDPEAYERLLDMYDVSFKNFAEGEVVKGIVLQVSESEVIVDVGYKSEGIIAIEEFRDETGKLKDSGGGAGRRGATYG